MQFSLVVVGHGPRLLSDSTLDAVESAFTSSSFLLVCCRWPKTEKSSLPITTKIQMADGRWQPVDLQRMRGALLWPFVSRLWNAHFVLHDLHHAHPYDEWEIE